MSDPHPLIPDEQRLREHLAHARLHGRPIARRTAHELATWFSGAVGPGFATFRSTGVVTGLLHAELGRLYDMQQPETRRWLDNLTRFILAQPVMSSRRRPEPEPEDSPS
jgi:hypothetical protein